MPVSLSSIDLNLLVALDALLRERSVTRAGQRIGLSQPAMSRALSRLRALLDDPILVRRGRAMRATPRAERLGPKVKQLLEQVHETLFDHEVFDPATCKRLFTIAASDYCGLVILPRLIARIAGVAPGVGIRVRPLSRLMIGPGEASGMVAGLLDGTLDLAVGTFPQVPDSLARADLFHDDFVCAVRAGHPKVKKRLTLERFCRLGHVLVTSPRDGPGVVDAVLESRGMSRQVAVRVPHFSVAPAVVAETDLVVTLARKIAQGAGEAHGLALFQPPIPLPSFPVSVLWHRLAARDAGLGWLREILVEVTEIHR